MYVLVRRDGQWWLAAGVFPQTSYYCMVALMPALLLASRGRVAEAGRRSSSGPACGADGPTS